MIEELVHFYAGGLKLEGVLTYNENASSSPALLLCAPHPNLGGDMDNNIITSLAGVSADMGFVSLRFNYRGVGNSEGHEKDIAQRFQYWDVSLNGGDYADAVVDAHTALNFFISEFGVSQGIFIAGYSFGALVGMQIAMKCDNIKAFAAVSTPFGRYSFDFMQHCKKSKLVIYSPNDFAASVEDTMRSFEKLSPPKTLELVENSDHFYRGQENHVSQKVCAFFQNEHVHKQKSP